MVDGIITHNLMDLLKSIDTFEKLATLDGQDHARLLIEVLAKSLHHFDRNQDISNMEHLWAVIRSHAEQLVNLAKKEERDLIQERMSGSNASI
jgi:hypothetical protein